MEFGFQFNILAFSFWLSLGQQEIKLIPQPEDRQDDCIYYMTLLRDDLQIAIGDCVYLVRDCKRSADGAPLRSSLRLVASTNPDKMDIFRVEELWKNNK